MWAVIFVCFLTLFMRTVPAHPIDNMSHNKTTAVIDYVRGCYFTNWAQYRQDKGKYLPEYYIPGLCTHIFYAFVVMDDQFHLKPFEWNDDTAEGTIGNYERVNHLKTKQSDLKTLLSFGGYTYSQANAGLLTKMAMSKENRKTFIQSVVNFVRERNFDGFDIDWEYPTEEDKPHFSALVKEMREEFEEEAAKTGKPRLLLTAAVAAGRDKIDAGYEAIVMAKYLDYVNVMTYDFHGTWETKTGFNSPLYDRDDDKMAVSAAAEHWNAIGVPRRKLLIGFGTYGRGWTLSKPEEHGVGAATMTSAPAQNYTKEAGVAAYYEICALLNETGVRRNYDDLQKTPYMVKKNVWFGYDDTESFNVKLTWLMRNGYGGAFVWTLDQDDFLGQCPSSNGLRYPLISTIAAAVGKDLPAASLKSDFTTLSPPLPRQQVQQSYSTPESTVSRSPSSTPASDLPSNHSPDFQCQAFGLYADPAGCATYYNCDQSGTARKMSCSTGTHFNAALKICDWPHNVKCPS